MNFTTHLPLPGPPMRQSNQPMSVFFVTKTNKNEENDRETMSSTSQCKLKQLQLSQTKVYLWSRGAALCIYLDPTHGTQNTLLPVMNITVKRTEINTEKWIKSNVSCVKSTSSTLKWNQGNVSLFFGILPNEAVGSFESVGKQKEIKN